MQGLVKNEVLIQPDYGLNLISFGCGSTKADNLDADVVYPQSGGEYRLRPWSLAKNATEWTDKRENDCKTNSFESLWNSFASTTQLMCFQMGSLKPFMTCFPPHLQLELSFAVIIRVCVTNHNCVIVFYLPVNFTYSWSSTLSF